jgi:hypothetical protein
MLPVCFGGRAGVRFSRSRSRSFAFNGQVRQSGPRGFGISGESLEFAVNGVLDYENGKPVLMLLILLILSLHVQDRTNSNSLGPFATVAKQFVSFEHSLLD